MSHKNRDDKIRNMSQYQRAATFFRQSSVSQIVLNIAARRIEQLRKNRKECPQHKHIITVILVRDEILQLTKNRFRNRL